MSTEATGQAPPPALQMMVSLPGLGAQLEEKQEPQQSTGLGLGRQSLGLPPPPPTRGVRKPHERN